MTDDPILAAMRMTQEAQERELQPAAIEGVIVPRNQVRIEGGAGKGTGAEVHGTIERERTTKHGDVAFGAEGGISQKQGWGVRGFFKWIWR